MKLTLTQITWRNRAFLYIDEWKLYRVVRKYFFPQMCIVRYSRENYFWTIKLFVLLTIHSSTTPQQRDFSTLHYRCKFNYHYKSHFFAVGKVLKGNYRIEVWYAANCFRQKFQEAKLIQFHLLLWWCTN